MTFASSSDSEQFYTAAAKREIASLTSTIAGLREQLAAVTRDRDEAVRHKDSAVAVSMGYKSVNDKLRSRVAELEEMLREAPSIAMDDCECDAISTCRKCLWLKKVYNLDEGSNP